MAERQARQRVAEAEGGSRVTNPQLKHRSKGPYVQPSELVLSPQVRIYWSPSLPLSLSLSLCLSQSLSRSVYQSLSLSLPRALSLSLSLLSPSSLPRTDSLTFCAHPLIKCTDSLKLGAPLLWPLSTL